MYPISVELQPVPSPGGRRWPKAGWGGSSTLEAQLFPLTLALSLRERGYIDAKDED